MWVPLSLLNGSIMASQAQEVLPGGLWKTQYSGLISAAADNYGNYTLRTTINRLRLPTRATKFRFTLGVKPGSGGTDIAEFYVGVTNNGLNYDSAPTQVFFGGLAGVTLLDGNPITSDEVELAYDGKENILYSFYISGGAARRQVGHTPTNVGFRSVYDGGNTADDIGGTRSSADGFAYNLLEVEAYVDSTDWIEHFRVEANILNNNWANYTLRTRYEVGKFPAAGAGYTQFRLGMMSLFNPLYIGNAVETAGSFDFASTPTQLFYNGGAASRSNFTSVTVTDTADLSVLDLTKPVLVSWHNTNAAIWRTSGQPETQSRYAAGGRAADMSGAGFGGYLGAYMGFAFLDVR